MADNDFRNPNRPADPDPADDDPFAELARIVGFDEDEKQAAATEPDVPVSEPPVSLQPERPVFPGFRAEPSFGSDPSRQPTTPRFQPQPSPPSPFSATPHSSAPQPSAPQPSAPAPFPHPVEEPSGLTRPVFDKPDHAPAAPPFTQRAESVDLENELLRDLGAQDENPAGPAASPGPVPLPRSSPDTPRFSTVLPPAVTGQLESNAPETPSLGDGGNARPPDPAGEPAWLHVSRPPVARTSEAVPAFRAHEVDPPEVVEPPEETPVPDHDVLPKILRSLRESVEDKGAQSTAGGGASNPPVIEAPTTAFSRDAASESASNPHPLGGSADDTAAFGSQVDHIARAVPPADHPVRSQPATGAPGERPSPVLSSDATSSLEAELEAAFDALEENKSTSMPSDAEVRKEVEAVVPPTESVTESDELASAYRKFEQDVQAALPEPDSALEDHLDDVNDMLLAEMAEVEAEAGEAAAQAAPPKEEIGDIPFDPASIADSDEVPEPMAEIEVPEGQTEDTAPAGPSDEDFGLPLEEELEALASEAAASAKTNMQSETVETDELDGGPVVLDVQKPDAKTSRDRPPGEESFIGRSPEDDGFHLDEDDLAVPEFLAAEQKQRTSHRGRNVAAALVVLGVAVAGGAGFYFWNSSLGSDSGNTEPPVIAANTEPVKVKPDDPGGTTVPNQDLAVYDRVSGDSATESADQSLVTTTEEPVDVVQRTLAPDALPLEGRDQSGGSLVKSEERLTASNTGGVTESSTPTTPVGGDAAVEPRKVRTLIVKPDGTIVARDLPETPRVVDLSQQNEPSSSGSSTQQEAESQSDGAVSTASTTTTQTSDNGDSGTQSSATAELTSETQPPAVGAQSSLPPIDENLRDTGETPVPSVKPVDATQAAESTGVQDTSEQAAPVPAAKPAQQEQQPVQVAAAEPNTTTNAARETTGSFDGYSMQISSQPTEAGARKSYADLSRRYASILSGRDYSIQRANIPEKGVFYRVRIPVGSRADATALCGRYQAAGGSCFVAR